MVSVRVSNIYGRTLIAAVGFLALAWHEPVRAGQQNADQMQTAKLAPSPKSPTAKASNQAKQECYRGSAPGVSCDGIAARAAVNQARDADQQALLGWWQLTMGVLTFGAALAAVYFARRAAAENKRSADIAERSINAIERPYLFVVKVTAPNPFLHQWYDVGAYRLFDANYVIKNYGRTPAIIKEIHGQIYVGTDFEAGVAINPAELFQIETVLGPGDVQTSNCFYRLDITNDMVNDLFMSRTFIDGVVPTRCFLFGHVVYESVHGLRDEVGFCWEFLVQNDLFYQRDIVNFTYRREVNNNEDRLS
jgi:hypothetical protein